ncbi:MAG TPA: PAS domain S-box protein [Nevskiaceae bacterium]|nr:PAS domain S-box protein [Nevskiaceae bacterium]
MDRPRQVLAGLAGLLIVLLAALGVWGLGQAGALHSQLVQGRAADATRTLLAGPLREYSELKVREAVRRLLQDPQLGLVYVAVRDSSGRALASEGRYERLRLPLLSGYAEQGVRSWLYRHTSRFQRERLQWQGETTGTIEYAVSDWFARGIREQAVDRLRLASLLALVLSLALSGVLVLIWRRAGGPAPLLLQRLQKEPPRGGEAAMGEQRERYRLRAGSTLDQMQQALIVIDRDARIRYLNAEACRLTGWSEDDADGRLVYSVFHALDDADAAQPTPAERALQAQQALTGEVLRLRARDGRLRPVEVMAAPLGSGRPEGALMIFRDISDREAQVEQWRRAARLAEGVIDHLAEGVVTTDPAGVIRFANARALRMFGYGREELVGVSVTKLLPVPFLNTPGVRLTDYSGAGNRQGRLPRVVGWRKDATTFPVELQVAPMTVDGAEGLVVITRDITERLKGENLSQRLGRLLDAAAEEIYIFDAQSLCFVEVNRGARRNLGYHPSEMTRMGLLSISADLDAATFQDHLARLRGGEAENLIYRCRHRRADGSQYPVEVRLSYSREEEPPVFMAIAIDISERESAEDRLRFLAHHDGLTGLPNRALFLDRLRQALLMADRGHRQVAVAFLDLDRFKAINDVHGHDVGDQVLRETASRLQQVLRQSDTVARLGGDEFVVLASGLRSLEDAHAVGSKIVEAFAAPMQLDGLSLKVAPSVGLTLYPADEAEAEELMRHADAAMYQAKQSGRGQYRIYSVDVPLERRRRMELERGIQTAVALNQFELDLLALSEADGAAAAVWWSHFHWRHPRYERVEAEEALQAADRAGLRGDLELWLLYTAMARRRSLGGPGLPLLLPLSGWQLRDGEFITHVLEVCQQDRAALPSAPPPVLVLDREGLREVARAAPGHRQRLIEAGVGFGLRVSSAGPAEDAALLDGLPLRWLVLPEPLEGPLPASWRTWAEARGVRVVQLAEAAAEAPV